VEGGVLEREARDLNPGFVSRMERQRPRVILKIAASLDGGTALADGESRWITGEAARQDVQEMRARASALLTGSGTVLRDDPRLDVRLPGATRQPLRVVLDSRLRVSHRARILALPGKVLVLCAAEDPERAAALRAAGAEIEVVSPAPGGIDLAAALALLAAREVNEIVAECGARLAGALLAARLVDELVLYQAPVLLGRGARPLAELPPLQAMSERLEFAVLEQCLVGADLRVRLRPRY
jgi:diaminohydroxyphosphoribosylaminopyrimidine deaminase/5-amino-6-(5-phosphoribosylamino)uracil reductase